MRYYIYRITIYIFYARFWGLHSLHSYDASTSRRRFNCALQRPVLFVLHERGRTTDKTDKSVIANRSAIIYSANGKLKVPLRWLHVHKYRVNSSDFIETITWLTYICSRYIWTQLLFPQETYANLLMNFRLTANQKQYIFTYPNIFAIL